MISHSFWVALHPQPHPQLLGILSSLVSHQARTRAAAAPEASKRRENQTQRRRSLRRRTRPATPPPRRRRSRPSTSTVRPPCLPALPCSHAALGRATPWHGPPLARLLLPASARPSIPAPIPTPFPPCARRRGGGGSASPSGRMARPDGRRGGDCIADSRRGGSASPPCVLTAAGAVGTGRWEEARVVEGGGAAARRQEVALPRAQRRHFPPGVPGPRRQDAVTSPHTRTHTQSDAQAPPCHGDHS